jgi:hypothetical protein
MWVRLPASAMLHYAFMRIEIVWGNHRIRCPKQRQAMPNRQHLVPLLSCWARRLLAEPSSRRLGHDQDAPGRPNGGLHRPVVYAVALPSRTVRHARAVHGPPLRRARPHATRGTRVTRRCPGWARRCRPTSRRCTTSWPRRTWSIPDLRAKRLARLHQALGDTPFLLCLDETGDRTQGYTTEDVAHQSSDNRQTLANGVVAVHADGLLSTTTFPLLVRVLKPHERLKPGIATRPSPKWPSRSSKSS